MILSLLREGTREQHRRLELLVDLPRRLSSLEAYQGLLEAFYGVYQPLESRLSEHRPLGHTGLAAERLNKHSLIEHDLLVLGRTPAEIKSLRRCDQLPDLSHVLAAAGCMYVLEGSTLGGQIVSREVEKKLHISPEQGCRFFTSYGARVRDMWSEFCRELTALAGDDADNGETIVKGASETFACFEEWMQ